MRREVTQPGAYVTNGAELYEVLRVKQTGNGPLATRWLEVENCRTLIVQQFGANVVNEHFRLVRAVACPDTVPEPERKS